MASFGRQFSASPVLTMPPQPAHQAPFGMAGFAHHHAPAPAPAPTSFGSMSFSSSFVVQHQEPPLKPSSGRKRSRDEAASNLEPDALPPPPAQEPEDEWVYGPGMVLIKANKGYVAEASTQSGTWMEEQKAAEEDNRRRLEEERKLLAPRSNKSQRRAPVDNSTAAPITSSLATSDVTSILPNGSKAPVIDDFTLHLGIGWRKISEDEHIQAAARGWARYIENHYPITNAQVRLESNGLQSYLVEASEGFFLFAENLRHGRLVSTNVEGALKNLQTSPPTFEGALEMTAAASPTVLQPQRDVAPVDTDMAMD